MFFEGLPLKYGEMLMRVSKYSGAPNENSWQISAPQPAYSWLASESEQIQIPSWITKNLKIL